MLFGTVFEDNLSYKANGETVLNNSQLRSLLKELGGDDVDVTFAKNGAELFIPVPSASFSERLIEFSPVRSLKLGIHSRREYDGTALSLLLDNWRNSLVDFELQDYTVFLTIPPLELFNPFPSDFDDSVRKSKLKKFSGTSLVISDITLEAICSVSTLRELDLNSVSVSPNAKGIIGKANQLRRLLVNNCTNLPSACETAIRSSLPNIRTLRVV